MTLKTGLKLSCKRKWSNSLIWLADIRSLICPSVLILIFISPNGHHFDKVLGGFLSG